MSDYAMFYTSVNGDRKYGAEDMSEYVKPFFTTGVFNGHMQVTASNDMTVTIAPGYCNIGGKVMNFTNAHVFNIDTAHGTLDRIDSVILRRDDVSRDIALMIVKGGYASNPVAPDLIRTGAYYDLRLAEIRVKAGAIAIKQEDIKDCRMNGEVCGWVASTVKEIDFSQITAQFEDFFSNYKNEKQTNFNNWFDQIKGQLSTDQAGNLQNQINEVKNDIKNKHSFGGAYVKNIGWSANKVPVDGRLFYESRHKVKNIYDSIPEIYVAPASVSAKVPDEAQQEAFALIKYAIIDTTTSELILYAEEKPTVSFSIIIKGVTV